MTTKQAELKNWQIQGMLDFPIEAATEMDISAIECKSRKAKKIRELLIIWMENTILAGGMLMLCGLFLSALCLLAYYVSTVVA